MHELIGLDEMAQLPGCEEVTPDLVDAILDEAGKLACDVLAPLNKQGDTQGCKLKDHVVTTPDGFKQAYRQFIDGGWTMLACDPDYGGQGLPAVVATPVRGDVARRQHGLCAVPDADAWRDRSNSPLRHRRVEAALPCENGFRGVDGHDEPHRAPGRLGSQRGAHQGGSRGRSLPAVRIEDLHHLRRARFHRKHHPPGAGAHARCARGGQGYFAVRGAEVPGQRRQQPGRAQRRLLRVHRAQIGNPCESHRGAGFWRQWRSGGLFGGGRKPRPGIHVHHDECRPLLGRAAGGGDCRARLPARADLCQGAHPGRGGGCAWRRQGVRSFATRTCAAC